MATINVGGSPELPGIAQHHFKENICDILAVTETHQRQDQRILTDYTQIGAPAPCETVHPRGGVSLPFKPHLQPKLHYRYATSHYQVIGARVRSIYVFAVYISPAAPAHIMRACLSQIQQVAKGTSLLIGDFNARHTNWDVKNNVRGRNLVKWAQKSGWGYPRSVIPNISLRNGLKRH